MKIWTSGADCALYTWKRTNISTIYLLFIVVVIRGPIFWDTTLCILLKGNKRYGGTCHHHLAELATHFTFISCLVYSSTPKKGATFPSKTSAGLQWTKQHSTPEDELFFSKVLQIHYLQPQNWPFDAPFKSKFQIF